MKILIADFELQMSRFGLINILKELWPSVIIHEAVTINGIVTLLVNETYDIAILNGQIDENGNLENLIGFILKEAKVIIFSFNDKINSKLLRYSEIGVEHFIYKNEPISILKSNLLECSLKNNNDIH